MAIHVSDGRAPEGPRNHLLVASIHVNVPDVFAHQGNRSTIARFLGIDVDTLPQDSSQVIRRVSIGGHIAAIISDSSQSCGKFSCIGMQHPQDFSPPLHVHTKEDEFFLIRDGHYAFQVGEELREFKPGDLLLAPKGVPHSFRCLSPQGSSFVFTVPGGFEDYFSTVSKLPTEGFKDRLLEVNRQFGIEFVGPPINKSHNFWEPPLT